MLEFLKSIGNFILNWVKQFTFKDWILLIISCLLIFYFCKSCSLQKQINTNKDVYSETLYEYINKANEAYKGQQLAILEKDKVKELNNELTEELQKLKDNPLVITKIETKFEVDTIYMESERIVENVDTISGNKTYELYWHYLNEPEFFTLSGVTEVNNDFSNFKTQINNLTVNSDFIYDIVDNGKQLEVLIRSNNPYINVTGIQSVMIDPNKSKTLKNYFKPKRWGIGPMIGIGVDKNLKFTPYIGIGVTYNVFQF